MPTAALCRAPEMRKTLPPKACLPSWASQRQIRCAHKFAIALREEREVAEQRVLETKPHKQHWMLPASCVERKGQNIYATKDAPTSDDTKEPSGPFLIGKCKLTVSSHKHKKTERARINEASISRSTIVIQLRSRSHFRKISHTEGYGGKSWGPQSTNVVPSDIEW